MNGLQDLNDNLHLIIFPTEQCMFRCVYCYERFNVGRMPRSIVTGVKNLLRVRGPEMRRLHIGWFGGEPLIAYDIIEDIMTYVHRGMPHPGQFVLTSDLTTNGWLLSRKVLGELVDFGCNRFQISLDGDKLKHDKLRVLQNGRGTFDLIWKNLKDAHLTDLNFESTIRLHINTENVESMIQLLYRIAETFESDPRFPLFIRGLDRFGGKNDANLPVMGSSSLARIVRELKTLASSLNIPLVDTDAIDNSQCYASRFGSYIIRATGRIGKCTVALYDEMNTIGQLSENGTMSMDTDKFGWWVRGNFSGDKGQLHCPLKAG